MKRIINIIAALAAVCFATSCQKEETTAKLDTALVGEWHLASTLVDGDELKGEVDVYLVFHSEGTFDLYQKTGSQKDRYDLYTGTCISLDGILTGVYASGTPWGSSYKYKVTGSTLTLKSSDMLEEQIYEKESLPSDIKVNTDTKTAETAAPIL